MNENYFLLPNTIFDAIPIFLFIFFELQIIDNPINTMQKQAPVPVITFMICLFPASPFPKVASIDICIESIDTNASDMLIFLIVKINGLNQSKKALQKRIDEAVLEELPTVSKKDIKEALSMFSTYIKEKNTIECKRFIDNYIDKIVVHRDKVELVLKVALSNFNTSESDNDSGALHITIVISREKLQKYPNHNHQLNWWFAQAL